MSALADTSMLLAKSEADELIDEVFLTFPTIFTGLVLGSFIDQYIKQSEFGESVVESGFPTQLAIVPGFTIAFVALSKLGVLGSISGIVAKVSLDGWNIFANVLLPGAILKY